MMVPNPTMCRVGKQRFHRMANPSPWTKIHMERATQLWNAGHSMTQIAALITDAFGIERTKNAVAGKFKKLGLFGTRPVRKRTSKARYSAKNRFLFTCHRFVAEALPDFLGEPDGLPPDEPIPATAVTLEDRDETQCVWPVNHGAPEFLYCGARKAAGEPRFCEHHAGRAYRVGGVDA
jgi:hypothetical protein